MALQHLRSSTAHKRPIPTQLSAGQIAVNTNEASPGLFFKDSNGDLVKIGPVHIGTSAPNSSPASTAATAIVSGTTYQILTVGTTDFTAIGASANTVGVIFTATGVGTGTGTVSGQQGVEKGEQWLDTTGGSYVLKIYDGSAWRSESGTFVDVNGDTMTGALLLDNAASASAPDLSFDGDADTGIYSPGADQVAIATGGTAAVTVDSSQRVGVGVSSPGYRLDVKSPGSGQFFINGQNSSGTNIFQVYESSTGDGQNGMLYLFNGAGNNDVKLSTNGASWFNGGSVGIGTTSAGHKLDLLVGGGSDGINVYNNATGAAYCQLATTSRSYKLEAVGSDLRIYDNTGSSEALRVDSSGNIGINTSSPSHPLTINRASGNWITLRTADSNFSNLALGTNGSSYNYLQSASGGSGSTLPLTFWVSSTRVMTLDSSGRVGVSRTSPYSQIHAYHATDNTILTLESGDSVSRINFIDNAGHAFIGNEGSDIVLATSSSATERVRILSGGGLTFNGDTAQANALDDYEEGTWTPSVGAGSVSSSRTVYTKIGRVVRVTAVLFNFSDRSSGSTLVVTGLPFTPSGSTADIAAGSALGRHISGDFSTAYITTSGVSFYSMSSGQFSSMTYSSLTNTASEVHFHATYTV